LYAGQLPPQFIDELEEMTLEQQASEAAKFRANGNRPGATTALILRWVKAGLSEEGRNKLQNLYSTFWIHEKNCRLQGRCSRPAIRPVKSTRCRSAQRVGFVQSDSLYC
jgi:hypothetical protein